MGSEKTTRRTRSTIEDSYRDAVDYAKEHAPEGDIKAKGLNGKFHHVQKGK